MMCMVTAGRHQRKNWRLRIVLTILVLCVLLVLFDVPGLVHQFLATREANRTMAQLQQRALILQQMWTAIGGEEAFEDATLLRKRVAEYLASRSSSESQYAIASNADHRYVLDKPHVPGEMACLLRQDGSVEFVYADFPPFEGLFRNAEDIAP